MPSTRNARSSPVPRTTPTYMTHLPPVNPPLSFSRDNVLLLKSPPAGPTLSCQPTPSMSGTPATVPTCVTHPLFMSRQPCSLQNWEFYYNNINPQNQQEPTKSTVMSVDLLLRFLTPQWCKKHSLRCLFGTMNTCSKCLCLLGLARRIHDLQSYGWCPSTRLQGEAKEKRPWTSGRQVDLADVKSKKAAGVATRAAE